MNGNPILLMQDKIQMEIGINLRRNKMTHTKKILSRITFAVIYVLILRMVIGYADKFLLSCINFGLRIIIEILIALIIFWLIEFAFFKFTGQHLWRK